MPSNRPPLLDRTALVLADGYHFIRNRRTRPGDDVIDTRVAGRPATVLAGEGGARVFYDGRLTGRRGAIPKPIEATLFGRGALHTLDGNEHRHRKAVFMSLMGDEATWRFEQLLSSAWRDAAAGWAEQRRIVLFDEAATVIWRAIAEWAGIPRDRLDEERMVDALVDTVDGFATPSAAYLRAVKGRLRAEKDVTALIEDVRSGDVDAPEGSALAAWAHHRGLDGQPLSARVAAVELLNALRPTVATAWFVAFTAHALITHPTWRERLRGRAIDDATMAAFAEEVRRFYPFTPFLGAKATRAFRWRGHRVPKGRLLLLDVHGTNHDPELWPEPDRFNPERFLERHATEFDLLQQGGGDAHTGHRCPGEDLTRASIRVAARMLSSDLDYDVPEQDLGFTLRRIPTRPRSGIILENVRFRVGGAAAAPSPAQEVLRGVSPG